MRWRGLLVGGWTIDSGRLLRNLTLLCLGGLGLAPSVQAHPHAWIDLQTSVSLDPQGRVEALDLVWLFDEWYTAVIAEEFQSANQDSLAFLKTLGRRNLENLKDYRYFTEVTVDGKAVELGAATGDATDLQGERLRMRFTVPLKEPADPRQHKIAIKVFDPSYYIEILYVEDDQSRVRFRGQGAQACSARVIAPNPSFEAVSLASALDRTQSGGDDLGRLFAETVELHCP